MKLPLPLTLTLASFGLATTLPRQSGPESIQDLPVERNGSKLHINGKEWNAVGANVYWLGIDENVIPPAGQDFYAPKNISYPTKGRVIEVMNIVKALGGTMIRAHTLGTNTGSPLSLMPEPGIMNDKAFEVIDFAVYQARQAGLRLMVPLVDNYDYYHGGKYDFMRWAGMDVSQSRSSDDPIVMAFYENPSIINSFKSFVARLLTHKNPLTGLTYADDPTIFAIESGNELLGYRWGDMNVPTAWVREMAQHVKTLAPTKLFVDGTYGVNATHFEVDEVDIFSNHFYPPSVDQLRSDLSQVEKAARPFFAGEFAWVENPPSPADELEEWFRLIEESEFAVGDTFWSLFGRNVPNCDEWVEHADGFTLSYQNPENSDYVNSRIKLIRKHLTKMSTGEDIDADADLPEVACPAEDAE